MHTPLPAPHPAARLLSGLLCVLLIVEPIAANAQVVAASGAGRPTVESAQNGVPLVQIVAPNGAGVSHNVYQSYSVDARGVVLNNSQVVVATQQAGYIAGNPNLAAGSARIILNEVSGTSPSDLRGFTEVAGAKADVVIANPNGITCSGCGFINTGRGILTTGTPVFGGSGSLDAFRVTGGTISIGENGLEGRYADQIDILARAVSVQGNVRANALNVVAGANQVAYASLAATPVAGTGAAPTTAIDVAALGGMYANKIRLVATEAGVGVNNRGTLVALAGDFRLDAAGHITQGGVVTASDQLDIATPGDLANTGSLFGRDITVSAANLTNRGTGVIAAGNSAGLYVTNTLVNLDGALLYSGGTLAIAGSAERGEDGRLTTKAAHLLNSSADILAEGDIEIAASAIDNKRTVFEFETTAVAGSRSTLLAQELDGDWDGELIGRTFANGWTSEVTTIEMVPGPEGPVPTEVTRTVFTPYGAYDWMVADAASVENFTILNLDRNARRYAIVTERLVDHLVAASPESRIIGRNVRVDADTLNNAASRFEASGDLTATVTGRFSNDGARLLNRNRRTMWSAACGDIQGDRPGRLGYCQDGGGFRWVADAPVDSDRTETADSPASTITAAGHYTLNAEQVSNGVTGAGAMPPGGFSPGRIGNLGNPGAYLFGLPAGGLYTVNPDGSTRYVVETDPRFTQFGNFIGSDYMLAQLGLDPLATQKRLGDAYYEQQLVRDQLLKLRGKTDYRSGTTLNAEYQALLESGAEFAREFHLTPGVTLTQEQVAALSRDIVWLETRKVAGQDVLVPVVYLGATYTPRSTSALMGGGKTTTITATDIRNDGGTIAGETVTLTAANDIVSESGRIEGQDVTLTAGRDIKLATATTAVELHAGQTFTQEGEASRIDARTLAMTAGNDLSLQGAQVTADSATLQAGRDLTVGSQAIATERNLHGVDYRSSRIEQRGSSLDIKTDLALIAGNDLTVAGSDVKAGRDLLAYAGNNLALVTARETETLATSAHSDHVDDVRQTSRDTGKASTLSAGNNLTLVAGDTLYTEGANLQAGQDATLQADTLVIAAAHDTYSENSNYSNIGKRGSQQSQTQLQTDAATGSIVQAGGDLNLTSSGDTIVEGSALAAGKQASIDVSGDLKLLAAQSSRYQDLYRSSRGAKEATELKYHEEGVRQLLTTITVGTGADIKVGGNFVAAIAEKNEDGTFKADRMTVDGIVKGDSRQQVDVKRTGDAAEHAFNPDGTPAKTQTSEVLGDLKAQGIRNGSNDSFDQKATQTGTEALQAYLQSGLIQVRNDPQVAAKLNRILQNSEGATLTYKDDTGKVSLTVAGQAKVQEVFDTLKLTETFDKKHFADQQTAMIVTLIVAIVLTICTAGAGAALIGAAQGTLAAAMANAAFIGMVSTMTGQLAGGASFDDAFQTGVKAGAISAVTAGIAYGAGEAVNSMNGVTPPAGTSGTVTTVQSGSQTIEVGSKAADTANTANQTVEAVDKLKGLDKLTNSIWWEKTALNAVGQGAFAEAQGGSFKDGFKGSMLGALSATGAQAIGDNTTGNPFGNIAGHAVLGCAVASASRLDCGSGALGGAASASLSRVLDNALPTDMSNKARDAIVAGATIGGTAVIASAAGKDVMVAANASANEVMNNHFKHPKDIEDRQAELDACKGAANPSGCSSSVRAKYSDLYDRNEAEVTNCASAAECTKQVDLLRQSQKEYQARIGELLDKGVGSLTPSERTELANLQAGLSGLDGLKNTAIGRAMNYGADAGDSSLASGITDTLISAAAGVGSTEAKGSRGTGEKTEPVVPKGGGEGARDSPDFVVSPSGTAYPVPSGAEGPVPVTSPAGKQTGVAYTGGEGGHNGQVDTIRIMDPTPPRGSSPGYPNGYIKYENASGQGVDPYTGRTLPNSQSHFPVE
ncbi:MAG: hemagglutinin repeat-containing protein [Rhodocyclales bacterium]|nr:hemagglutinin repeat-containing protein [Rhodocyclales bacterium]